MRVMSGPARPELSAPREKFHNCTSIRSYMTRHNLVSRLSRSSDVDVNADPQCLLCKLQNKLKGSYARHLSSSVGPNVSAPERRVSVLLVVPPLLAIH